jgi:hypothetical protein
LKGDHIDHIVLQETFWTHREEGRRPLKQFVSNIAEKLRAENIDGAETGYPRDEQVEVEFGEMPPGTRYQDPHMDGCWYGQNVLVPLQSQTASTETFVKSTWVAKPDTDWNTMVVEPIDYHQFQLKCNPEAPAEALSNHMAWPHHGHGNMGSQPRSSQEHSFLTQPQ